VGYCSGTTQHGLCYLDWVCPRQKELAATAVAVHSVADMLVVLMAFANVEKALAAVGCVVAGSTVY
jgi:hypothetical protein